MLTDMFFIVNFSISIVASVIGLIFCLAIIFTVAVNPTCQTVTNLLTCNSSIAIGLYFIIALISAHYGLREDWISRQPACSFRAYCLIVSCSAMLYSHCIQAISRLMYAVFYKHKNLHTWRVHWIMIVINWSLSILLSIVPFFFNDGYGLEKESRLCTCTTKTFFTSMFVILTIFIIPFSIATSIYIYILNYVRQSTRRIRTISLPAITPIRMSTSNHVHNLNREKILAQNMLILLSIMAGAGIPYLILVFWNLLTHQHPPEPLYLLIINSLTICSTLMIIILFAMNKQMKDSTREYLRRHIRNTEIRFTRRLPI